MFQNTSDLSYVLLPNSITEFETSCFENTPNLKQLNLPSSLQIIRSYTFKNSGILSLEFTSTIDTLESYAFSNSSIISIDISMSNITNLNSNVFANTLDLSFVILPNVLTNISENAFANSSLTSVIIPSSLRTLGERSFKDSNFRIIDLSNLANISTIPNNCFENTLYLENIIFSSNVTRLNNESFLNSAINNLTLSSSINYIGDRSFKNSSIKILDLSSTQITQIRRETFQNTISFEQIYFPQSLNEWALEYRCFQYSGIETITFPVCNLRYLNKDVFQYSRLRYIDFTNTKLRRIDGFRNTSNLETVIFPSDVTDWQWVGRDAFRESNISNINLPDGITDIWWNAFQGSKLKYIDLSNTNVTHIRDNVFQECLDLSYAILPNTLKNLNNGVFYNSGIYNIIIPPSVQYLGSHIFSNCFNLQSITFMNLGNTNISERISEHILSNLSGIKVYAYNNTKGVISIGGLNIENR